ncbi:MAG: hypothetical protein ACOYI3_08550, partial [Christensenellales bacterium]
SGAMRHYPSRIAQIARAVWKGELEATEYGADTVFAPVLSGLGERWQNFGEDRNDYLLVSLLFRELFVQKGFKKDAADALRKTIADNGGHILPVEDAARKRWEAFIPTDEASSTCLFIDDASFAYASGHAYELGAFLKKKGIAVQPDFGPYFAGFEYFAAGLIDEGIEHLRALVEELKDRGVHTVITVSGQSQYVLTTLCSAMGIEHSLRVRHILEYAQELCINRAYLLPGSFLCRYLPKVLSKIDELTAAEGERRIKNSKEFLPLVENGKRVNLPTMWLAPLCAEYVPFGGDDALQSGILANGIREIKRAGYSQLVVFDPFEFRAAQDAGLKPVYYLSLMG